MDRKRAVLWFLPPYNNYPLSHHCTFIFHYGTIHVRKEKVGLHPEQRYWMQHAIMEAEKNTNVKKKGQFLRILEDLNHKAV
ncbi:MAG: hypothetical protein ACOWW1_02305 [archaeon]